MTKSYDEILHPAPVDERSGDEIVADIVKRAGLTVVDSAENNSPLKKQGAMVRSSF